MPAQTQPRYVGEPVPSPRPPALRVVRTPQGDPNAPAVATRRTRAGAHRAADVPPRPNPHAGRHAQRTGSTLASLAEVQIGISVVQLADQALGEVAVLLGQMRDVAHQAAGRDADRQALQSQIVAVVEQIDMISREVRFDGATVFDGTMADLAVPLPVGGRLLIEIAPMNGRTLGIESPWGRATTAREAPDVELVSSTGTLPTGTFRVAGERVFGDAGAVVGRYDGATVDFGSGVTATFDGSVYFDEVAPGNPSGVFVLDSVLSVRTQSAAEHAVLVLDRAVAMITEQRLLLGWSRSQLAEAAAATQHSPLHVEPSQTSAH
ncbi:MAG: hypothetical protein IPI32_08490 [Austwickia sp.]|jgi:flagellin-like hook-associated protein FlgL|nr:hypothetical protein [Austwickia sp.]